MSALVTATIELEDRFASLVSLLGAFDALAGDDTPEWLFVVRQHTNRVDEVLEQVSKLARVLP